MFLHNFRLKLFYEKLKSRWSRPFTLLKVYLNGEFDLIDERINKEFKVNGQIVKQTWELL